MLKPEQIAKESESSHQTALMQWAALNQQKYPCLKWLFHIPNGGARGDNQKSNMIRGVHMKAAGVKKGVPDLFLPVSTTRKAGLFIEMKKPSEKPVRQNSAGGLSKEQIEFAEFVKAYNYEWHVCYSWEDAVAAIENYLNF